MWLRFIAISIVKWFVFLIATILLLQFVIPNSWSGYMVAAPLWFVAFVVAFGFAEWAFGKRLPDHRDVWRLLLVWMVVSFTLQIIYATYFLGNVLIVINSPDTYVQYLLEILAIFLAARTTQRRKFASVRTEGLAE